MSAVRIASVNFLNARPLVRGFRLSPRQDRYTLSECVPAVCAQRLAAGEADVALIPSIEYQRIPGLRVLPGMAIASRRRARSVLLISRVAAPEIRRVALDTSSRTSAALARIWLDRRARNPVEYREAAPRFPAMMEDFDAALLIGDAALRADTRDFRVYDLAEQWFEMTGLPFVFAFWAVRPGVRLPEGIHPFVASRKLGLESIPSIAREESVKLELPEPMLEAYLRENIHYDLGAEEIRALWLFFRLAREAGMVASARDLALHDFAPVPERAARAAEAP
jgi:chorismate dehydratase